MSGSESTADTPAEVPASPDGNSLVDHIRRRWEAIKAGDAGTWPVIIGLILIVALLLVRTDNYFTAGNFTNLMVQMAGVTMLAYGVVFVLLIGEIDLSIGYVCGIAGVVVAEAAVPGGQLQTSGIVAIIAIGVMCADRRSSRARSSR